MNKNPNENVIEKFRKVSIVCWSILGVTFLIGAFLFVLYQIRVVFPLAVYTVILVYLLRSPVDYFETKGIPRVISLLITYVIAILLIVFLFWYFIPLLVDQFGAFVSDFPAKYYPSIKKAVQDFLERYEERFQGLNFPEVNTLMADLLSRGREFGLKILARLPGVTINIFSGIINLVLAPILAFYVLKDWKEIRTTLSELVPEDYRQETMDIVHKIGVVMGGFLRGQLLVAVIVGILSSLGLWLVGVDFAIAIGAISGILNIIPYLGPVIGGAIAVIVGFFNSPLTALLALIVMFAVQQIDSMFISPLVMRQQVNLHPVLIVFALIIGGSLLGILGMILAIPVAAGGKVLLYHFIEKENTSG